MSNCLTGIHLDDQFVQHDVDGDDGLLQLIVVQVVLLCYLAAEHLGVHTSSETVRTASFEELQWNDVSY